MSVKSRIFCRLVLTTIKHDVSPLHVVFGDLVRKCTWFLLCMTPWWKFQPISGQHSDKQTFSNMASRKRSIKEWCNIFGLRGDTKQENDYITLAGKFSFITLIVGTKMRCRTMCCGLQIIVITWQQQFFSVHWKMTCILWGSSEGYLYWFIPAGIGQIPKYDLK